jgi:hypothetical protein
MTDPAEKPGVQTTVELITPEGGIEAAEITFWRLDGCIRMKFHCARLPDQEFYNPDLFPSIVELRRRIEPEGWRLLCNAARLDVFFGGMLRNSGSVLAYRPTVDCFGAPVIDLVPALGPAGPQDVGSLREQGENLERLFHLEPGKLSSYYR